MKNPFKLDRVAVRLVAEPPLLSNEQLNNAGKVVQVLGEEIKQYDREVIGIINMHTDSKPINMTIASIGELNSALANPRELLKATILSNAAGIVMLHNHPSGNLVPSTKDILITDKLKMVCDLIDVELLDHIIVGRGREYFSFQEKNILPPNSIRLNRNLEEVNLGKNISESIISTMERLKEAQKRSEEIRSVQGKTAKAMGWER